MGSKKKVLWWSDSPTTATGFATVAKNLLKVLNATNKYEFTVVGINHNGAPYDRSKFPYDIYPALNALAGEPRYQDVYGRQLVLDMAMSGEFDIVFMIQDTFIVESLLPSLITVRENLAAEKKFSIIHYFPIDGVPKKSWIENVVAKVDIPVAYTEFAKKECIKYVPELATMDVIYHGVEKETFYPINNKEFRDTFYKEHADKFIVLNVNRNQPRKDLYRTFASFAEFHTKYPDSFLFILAQASDVGGNLVEIASNYGLVWGEDWACPSPGSYGANQGYPVHIVNEVYNACDVVVSTTTGEGWGLSFSEGAACKKPLLFPKNTSLVEMIGENEERGYFIESGTDANLHICMGAPDNNIIRPMVDIHDMASKLEHIYNNREEATSKAERAYKEIWTWKQVGEQWKGIFSRAEQLTKELRSVSPEIT